MCKTFIHMWHDSLLFVTLLIQSTWTSTFLLTWSTVERMILSANITWVMSHVWISYVTHMNGLCHPHEWVMSHMWVMHIAHMNESCHTYGWVMSHIWLIHVTREMSFNDWQDDFQRKPHLIPMTHMDKSWWHTHEWVMSQIWISHVTHMKESFHT